MKKLCLLLILAITPLICLKAEEVKTKEQYKTFNSKKGFFTIGAATIWSKSIYKGADDTFFPMPFITYANKRFSFMGLGMNYKIFLSKKLDISLNARTSIGGFDPDKSDYLQGMRKRSWQLSAGPSAIWKLGKNKTTLSFLTDISNEHNGSEIAFSFGRSEKFGKWVFTPSISALWQNAKMANYYYGVYPNEARAWRPAYKPSDILKVGTSFSVNFMASKKLFWFLRGSYKKLNSQITNSPIINSSNESTLIFGVSTKI
jgi:outer membrane protein